MTQNTTGSKLTQSIRQAKTKRNTPSAKTNTSKQDNTLTPKISKEVAITRMPSNRVWPD